MKIWKYIETHHEEYGVALFVVPPLAVVCVVIGVGYAFAELLSRL